MHQELNFYLGNKKYMTRNGMKVKITARERVRESNTKITTRYYGHAEADKMTSLIWFADGTCAAGDAWDLMEAADWRVR